MKPHFKQISEEEFFKLIPKNIKDYRLKHKHTKSHIKICSEDRGYPVLTEDWEPGKKRYVGRGKVKGDDKVIKRNHNPKAMIQKNCELSYEINSMK